MKDKEEKEDNLDKSIEDFTKAINLDSENTNALYGRADAYKKKNDLKKASKDYVSLGKLREDNGEHLENSIREYTEAIKLDPTNITAYFETSICPIKE